MKKAPGKGNQHDDSSLENLDLSKTVDFLNQLMGGSESPDPASLYHQACFLMVTEEPENLVKAGQLLKQAAELGQAEAQFLLGTNYETGSGLPQDYALAEKWYRQAAEQDEGDACAALGSLYHNALGLAQNYEEAFKWYMRGAELGSADAEFGLGILYGDGWGVEKDFEESLKWYRRAAEQGNERAANNLGIIYTHGREIEADQAEAAKWFARAVEAGSNDARYNLGVLYEKGRGVAQDLQRAAKLYEEAAEHGHANAMNNLGLLYANGAGVEKDERKAADLYRRAADNGNLTALSNLAVLFQHGRGVEKDCAEAARLYRQCADAGLEIGQYNLGTMYARGLGVPQNYDEAAKLYRLAADQGRAAAQNNLGDCYENGHGVPQDYAEAAKWYRKAAEQGISVAQLSMGLFCRDGKGVEQNYLEAQKWLKLASEAGLEQADKELEELYAAGHISRPEAPKPPVKAKPRTSKTVRSSKTPAASPEASPKLTVKIVDAQVAAKRALCLQAFTKRGLIEAMLLASKKHKARSAKIDAEALKTELKETAAWLKDEGLWSCLSENEKAFLTLNPGRWSIEMATQASWRAEALAVIHWALGRADKIAPYDQQHVSEDLLSGLGLSSQKTITGARLRPAKEIALARETAERWLWRARTWRIQQLPEDYPPPPGWTYEKIIRAAAEQCEKDKLFKAIDGDFPAHKKAYRDVTAKEWQTLDSIARERLYGLNWLCGYSANWDLVPANT